MNRKRIHLLRSSRFFVFLVFFACSAFPRRIYYSNYYRPEFQCSAVAEWEDLGSYQEYMKTWNTLREFYNEQNRSKKTAKNVIAGNSLVHLFHEELLRRELPDYDIVNRGIGGDSTFTFLNRLEDNVLALKPSVVILEIGGNDLIQGKCLSSIEENVKTIIRKIKTYNPKIKIAFLSVPPTKKPNLNSIVPVYNAFLWSLAKPEEGIFYLDAWRYMRDANAPIIKEEYARENDPIHFGEKGYEVWGQLIRSVAIKN